jgi:transposase
MKVIRLVVRLVAGNEGKKGMLKAWYASLSGERLGAIENVSMDIWPAVINVILESLSGGQAKIALDKFHIAKYLDEAVDRVRRLSTNHVCQKLVRASRAANMVFATTRRA